ncbi:MAG: hypothetical protein L7T81_02840, partial [Candidatus Poseidoniaceae archaeon]|nr:hypothetical protein [Candidatus Poseidoniaceae archaeon]
FKQKGRLTKKQVFWFLATTEKITVKLSKEHHRYMWLDWDLAIDMATHDETKGTLTKAKTHADRIGLV